MSYKFQISLNKNRDNIERLEEIERKYNQLIKAVSSKYPGETKHDTALRYIVDRENSMTGSDPPAEVKLTDADSNNAIINRNQHKITKKILKDFDKWSPT